MLAHGRNLETITQVDTIDSFVGIRDDLWRTSQAYYVAELLDRLTEERSENRELFRAVVSAFDRIARSDRPSEALHHFEVNALDLLGFRPELKVCVRCRESLRPVGNAFSTVSGGILCGNCRGVNSVAPDISANAIRMLRVYLADDWATTTRLRIDADLADEVTAILRAYTYSVAETALKSDRFVQELRREYLAQVPPSNSPATIVDT